MTYDRYSGRYAEISGVRRAFFFGNQKKNIEKTNFFCPQKVTKFCSKKKKRKKKIPQKSRISRKLRVYG